MNTTILLLLTCCVLFQVGFSKANNLEGVNRQVIQVNGLPHNTEVNTKPFQKIGSKLYYIEKVKSTNWFAALSKCQQLGGNLVNLQSFEEIQALKNELIMNASYWVDLTNFADGEFRSLASGVLKGTYPNWQDGEPNNARGNEHCARVYFHNGGLYLYDDPCSLDYLFICESKAPTTITIVSW